jgi:hypothetical protein
MNWMASVHEVGGKRSHCATTKTCQNMFMLLLQAEGGPS